MFWGENRWLQGHNITLRATSLHDSHLCQKENSAISWFKPEKSMLHVFPGLLVSSEVPSTSVLFSLINSTQTITRICVPPVNGSNDSQHDVQESLESHSPWLHRDVLWSKMYGDNKSITPNWYNIEGCICQVSWMYCRSPSENKYVVNFLVL